MEAVVVNLTGKELEKQKIPKNFSHRSHCCNSYRKKDSLKPNLSQCCLRVIRR
jgi:hypothetical protein